MRGGTLAAVAAVGAWMLAGCNDLEEGDVYSNTEIDERVGSLQTRIAALQAENAAQQVTIAALQTENAAQQTTIDARRGVARERRRRLRLHGRERARAKRLRRDRRRCERIR
ncbi:MAG: hypothetical protein ACYSU0_20825 [Planctomycetota bacterium]